MDRDELLPASHRAERRFLLDLLSGVSAPFDDALDAGAFLRITPRVLYPVVHRRLSAAPASMQSLLAQHHRENAFQHLRRIAELRRIGDAFVAENIDYLVLKGPVLAATVYDDPAARTMLDLDFLVHELAPAMEVLTSLGYVVPEQLAGVTMNAGDAPPMWNGEPGSPVIELHALLDSAPDNRAALDAAWASVRRVEAGNGITVPTLGLGEFVAHVIMHVSRHHRFEGELRSLLDVALLMRSNDVAALDWNELAHEWERRGIASWIALTVVLANVLLGSPVPEALLPFAPSREALILAAEQLWIQKELRPSGRITSLFTRQTVAPVHSHAASEAATLPRGALLRARRPLRSAQNLVRSLRSGALRPRNVAESVSMLRKRERLFAIVESTSSRR